MNLSFIKKAAPWIGTIVGTAIPAAAPFISIASKLLSDGLGKSVAPTVDAVTKAVTDAMMNPADLAKLKEIDNQFALQMKQMDIQSIDDWERIAAADRADARSMQVQTRSWIPGFLAVGITAGLFGLLAVMAYHALPTANEKAFDIMLGSLATAWIAVVNYYLGSSAGSAEKTRLLSLAPAVDGK